LRAVITDPRATGTTLSVQAGKHLSGAVLGPVSDIHPLAGKLAGVQVLEVKSGSPAWSTGLRPNDIIVSINQVPVTTVDEVTAALQRDPDALQMNIRRGNSKLYIEIR